MNFISPLVLSLFIHFGLVLSFSNLLKIDFDSYNIEAKKPIQAYLITEKRKDTSKNIYVPISSPEEVVFKNKDIEKKIDISDINDEIEKISKLENNIIAQKPNKKGLTSEADLEKYSSEIKTQVFENWKRPQNLKSNLKTEIQIILVPTGEILSATIIKSSGNETFDESALTAISKVKSFDGLNMQMSLFDQHFRKFILIFSPE
tara:strand:+ start:785 stop:1396 length:612 start_codon:yes stop_codon:yes gene_type:complete